MDPNFFGGMEKVDSSLPWQTATAATGAGIDLNEQLIRNRQATFFMRVNSDAMEGAGIRAGDVVIVDRSMDAKNGKVIIALLDGELLIRQLFVNAGSRKLVPATSRLAPIDITEASAFEVWGVVTFVIHSM